MFDLLVNFGQDGRDDYWEEYNNDIQMARGFKGIADRMKEKMAYASAARLSGLKPGERKLKVKSE